MLIRGTVKQARAGEEPYRTAGGHVSLPSGSGATAGQLAQLRRHTKPIATKVRLQHDTSDELALADALAAENSAPLGSHRCW